MVVFFNQWFSFRALVFMIDAGRAAIGASSKRRQSVIKKTTKRRGSDGFDQRRFGAVAQKIAKTAWHGRRRNLTAVGARSIKRCHTEAGKTARELAKVAWKFVKNRMGT